MITFSVQGIVGCPTAPDTENRVGDQENRSLGRSVSSMLQLPGVPGRFVQEQERRDEILAARFLQNVLQLHQQI